jgi:hypothetical protein
MQEWFISKVDSTISSTVSLELECEYMLLTGRRRQWKKNHRAASTQSSRRAWSCRPTSSQILIERSVFIADLNPVRTIPVSTLVFIEK